MRQALGQLVFQRTEADHAVFVKTWKDGRQVVLATHVDDCMATGTNQRLVDESNFNFQERDQ
jgi:hypothetical protein